MGYSALAAGVDLRFSLFGPVSFLGGASYRYLFAVGQLSHAMSSYRIDPERGTLTKLKEYPVGKNPNWVEIVNLSR